MAHFIPIARIQAAALLNRVCFRLKLFPRRQSVLSEHPVSALSWLVGNVGLVRTSFRLQGCKMLAEGGYLLDNMTYIEIESSVSFRGHSTVMAIAGVLQGI